MPHHRDVAIHQNAHDPQTLGAALAFHGAGTPLQETSHIAYCLIETEMKAEKRHVGHNQGTRPCARGCFQVMIHHFHADGKRIVDAQADIADTITDENDFDRCVGDARRDRIVSCRHRDGTSLGFPLLQDWNGEALQRRL